MAPCLFRGAARQARVKAGNSFRLRPAASAGLIASVDEVLAATRILLAIVRCGVGHRRAIGTMELHAVRIEHVRALRIYVGIARLRVVARRIV